MIRNGIKTTICKKNVELRTYFKNVFPDSLSNSASNLKKAALKNADVNSTPKTTQQATQKPSKSRSSSKKNPGSTNEKTPQKIRLAAPREDGAYALDDWVPARMGFGELERHLNPETSEVDRVCKFLLDQNFPIRCQCYKTFFKVTEGG